VLHRLVNATRRPHTCRADVTILERVHKGVLVDNGAAAGVD